MGYINYNAEYNSNSNNNFSLLKSVKRSSLVWSDDAVETFKRHADDKYSAAEARHV